MNDNFAEIMYHFFSHRVPLGLSVLLVILFCMPMEFFELSGLRPQVGIICVYYWVEKRPYIFGPISAFLLGLLTDVCCATPLGINCFLLMMLAFSLNKIYHYFHPASFVIDWLFFALNVMCFALLKWLIFAIYFSDFLNFVTIMPNIFSTIMFYPLIAYINNWFMNKYLPPERIHE